MKRAACVRPAAEEKVESFLAVTGDVHPVWNSAAAQSDHRQLHIGGVVFDVQDLDFFVCHGSPMTTDLVPFAEPWQPAAKVKKKVAPLSTSGSAHMRPPCLRTMRWTVASPTPVPSSP